jgi:flagellar basal-body rod protein FlgB
LAWQLHNYSQEAQQEHIAMKIGAFAHHEQALKFRAERNEVLASNIANSDTPNYKARDLDFASAMKNAQGAALPMKKTSEQHVSAWNTSNAGAQLKYRVPMQPALDGNTVESDVEQSAFAENAVQYRASLTFLNGAVQTLRYALKGSD